MTSPSPSNEPCATVSEMDKYLFDLRGYLVIKQAIDPAHLQALNAALDAIPAMKKGQWYGYVHCHSFGTKDGINLQQIYEGGEPFEQLVDHPAWIETIKTFVGGQKTFDANHGPLFIDECFANIRGPGEAIGLHSGGHKLTKRTQYLFRNGDFACGQVNCLMALTPMGPGDGATMVIPGSHKANFPHPQAGGHTIEKGGSVDTIEGAVEVNLEAGDVVLFVDAISHGSARRTNPGNRRTLVYRYGPSWGFFRHGYRPSPELLRRLTPERRKMVWPHEPMPRVPNLLKIEQETFPAGY